LGTKGAVSFGPKIFFMFISPPSARKRRKLEVGAGLAFLRTKMANGKGKWKINIVEEDMMHMIAFSLQRASIEVSLCYRVVHATSQFEI
jgi:hypothetical protein